MIAQLFILSLLIRVRYKLCPISLFFCRRSSLRSRFRIVVAADRMGLVLSTFSGIFIRRQPDNELCVECSMGFSRSYAAQPYHRIRLLRSNRRCGTRNERSDHVDGYRTCGIILSWFQTHLHRSRFLLELHSTQIPTILWKKVKTCRYYWRRPCRS